ncbi:MAG: trypsin-like peptidase domain-containing protein [Planctomycetaceae bacterium]|nr:trypsin-like peptidase domain-containing protein [Planctomycetaceae bacterium]
MNIHTEKTAADEKDSRFFSAKSRKVTGMGTGIVVDERGYIVTNFHVIQDVDLITVTLDGGATFDARTVSYDRKHDLAIIRVNTTEPLSVMPMGTSSDLMLAETVYAVGNAFGYEHTVTAGIISALHRDVEVDETQSYENLIQTDASINPGNSGGPLLNLNGEVIGINVAIRSGAQRIGFAIPIDDARKTIARLMSVERLNGVAHGLAGTDVKSPTEKKLVVEQVATGSAADLCGIKTGDVIRSVRGVTIQDGTDFERSLLDLPRGKVVDVTLVRDGKEQTMQFTVGVGKQTGIAAAGQQDVVVAGRETRTSELPTLPISQSASTEDPVMSRTWDVLGVKLAPLSDTEKVEITGRTYPGAKGPVRYNGGLRVVSVRPNSVAARILKEGDILLGLDGFETLGANNLSYILGDNRIRQAKSMKCQYYRRGSNPLEGTLQLGQ